MAVPVVNLSIDQGTRFFTSVKIKLDGADLNLSGYTFSSKLKKHYGAATSYPFTVSVGSTTNGIINIGMASTITATIPPGRYVYDVLSTLSGSTTKIVEGTVIVSGTASTGPTIPPIRIEDLDNFDSSTTNDKYVMIYDSSTQKYKMVNPDEVLNYAAETEAIQPGLVGYTTAFLDRLNADLDKDLDAGLF